MEAKRNDTTSLVDPNSPIFAPNAFSRNDETDDTRFYERDRFVQHLDRTALDTVEHIIGNLIVEKNPAILDLMAGWDSHIPSTVQPSRVVGLGLNRNEMDANPALSEAVIHDVNRDPSLPFPDDSFDAVINTVSVDYMTQPIALFQEVHRILKPGGLFLVVFSNRMFPPKAVKVWKDAAESERLILVNEFFQAAGGFEVPQEFVSMGKPRPRDDKYAFMEIPSDPIFAVYAEKQGGNPDRPSRKVAPIFYDEPKKEDVARRRKQIKDTLACPHCGEKLSKWMVPENPFCQTWDNDFMYICFNDACPYFVRGWDQMEEEGNRGMSYRLMYDPVKDHCMPVPVPSNKALREGIAE
jgi:SAM-dependent methyltransferase